MAAEREHEDDAAEGANVPTDEAPRVEPAKKAKKTNKKSGAAEADAKKEPEPVPGAGTADGDKLREALRAFEVGDYARVRARTRELAAAGDPKVREAAAALASRIAVDPVQVVVILACAAVLVAIALVWVF